MSKKDMAVKLIKNGIVNGTFPPDCYLQEVALSERFEMSRTPIREALLVLEKEGYITIVPNKGARVVKLDASDIRQISEAREAIEVMATYLSVGKIPEEILQDLREKFEMEIEACKTYKEKTVAFERFTLGEKLHEVIFRAAGNHYLVEINESLSFNFARLIGMSRTVGRYEQALHEHLNIVIALQNSNQEEAMQAMRHHIRSTTRDILNIELMN